MTKLINSPRLLLPLVFAMLLAGATFLLADSPSTVAPTSAAALPGLPAGWPSSFQIGSADSPGGAAALKAVAPFGMRYQYLAGGVNTGNSWAYWNANGDFVTYYIQDSAANGITPVFTYYMIRHSNPGASAGEADGVYNNLQNVSTMTAYWNDLKLFFQKAGATGTRTILHMEPDMWGYMEHRSAADDATTVPAQVASTNLSELQGLPNNMRGFAQAVIRLRDRYATNVTVGYHASIWGTGNDITLSNPNDATVDALAAKAAKFYNTLSANFDLIFAEFSDRDAAFKQYVYGDGGSSHWDSGDFARNTRFLSGLVEQTQRRVVIWQIPLGNSKMLAQNNTWNHYQDNKVEWFLDNPGRTNLNSYIQAGVIALLYGRGADGNTCACDAASDGVTNPAAINGNTTPSLNSDDDGGFFKQKVSAYYSQGPSALSGGTTPPPATSTSVPSTATGVPATATRTATGVPATATGVPATATRTATAVPATATRTSTPGASSTATRTPTRTSTPAPSATSTPTAAQWTTSAISAPSVVRKGQPERATVTVRSNKNIIALVDIEIYSASGAKVYQKYLDNISFTANVSRSFDATWVVPAGAATGGHTVKIGIFGPGWNGLYTWNNGAATFTVTN